MVVEECDISLIFVVNEETFPYVRVWLRNAQLHLWLVEKWPLTFLINRENNHHPCKWSFRGGQPPFLCRAHLGQTTTSPMKGQLGTEIHLVTFVLMQDVFSVTSMFVGFFFRVTLKKRNHPTKNTNLGHSCFSKGHIGMASRLFQALSYVRVPKFSDRCPEKKPMVPLIFGYKTLA